MKNLTFLIICLVFTSHGGAELPPPPGHEAGGGEPLIQGFRERMLFAGDFVVEARPELKKEIKDIANYKLVVGRVPIKLVSEINDPEWGLLTARAVPIAVTEGYPDGFLIEVSLARYPLLLNRTIVSIEGPESDPYGLPFHEGLRVSKELDNFWEISKNLKASDADYLRWRAKNRLNPEESLTKNSFSYPLKMASQLYVWEPNQEVQIIKKANDEFVALYPEKWAEEEAARIKKFIGSSAAVKEVKVRRSLHRVVTVYMPLSTEILGYYATAIATVDVTLELNGKQRLRRIVSEEPVSGSGEVISQVDRHQAKEAHTKALASYRRAVDIWKQTAQVTYPQGSPESFVYSPVALNSPFPTYESAPWSNLYWETRGWGTKIQRRVDGQTICIKFKTLAPFYFIITDDEETQKPTANGLDIFDSLGDKWKVSVRAYVVEFLNDALWWGQCYTNSGNRFTGYASMFRRDLTEFGGAAYLVGPVAFNGPYDKEKNKDLSSPSYQQRNFAAQSLKDWHQNHGDLYTPVAQNDRTLVQNVRRLAAKAGGEPGRDSAQEFSVKRAILNPAGKKTFQGFLVEVRCKDDNGCYLRNAPLWDNGAYDAILYRCFIDGFGAL